MTDLKFPEPPEGLSWWVSPVQEDILGGKRVQVALVQPKTYRSEYQYHSRETLEEGVLYRSKVRTRRLTSKFLFFTMYAGTEYSWEDYTGVFWDFVKALPLDTLENRLVEGAQRALVLWEKDEARKKFNRTVSQYAGLYKTDRIES